VRGAGLGGEAPLTATVEPLPASRAWPLYVSSASDLTTC
jgi:hypothetical protein